MTGALTLGALLEWKAQEKGHTMIGRYAEFGVMLNYKPLSKGGLKRAMKEAPDKVRWLEVGTVGNNWQSRMFSTADLLAEGFSEITLVGPDPYTSRKWYGTLSAKPDGSVKLS